MAFNYSQPINFGPGSDPANLFTTTYADTLERINRNTPDYGAVTVGGIQADGVKRRGAEELLYGTARGVADANTRFEINKINADSQLKQAEEKNKNALPKALFSGGIALASAFISDERTKNTINKIDDALATLRQLKPVTYYYNEEYSSSPERLHHGFIAQDYAKVLPDATYYDDSLDLLRIDTNELIALLVRAVQQLESRVTRMEAKSVLEKV